MWAAYCMLGLQYVCVVLLVVVVVVLVVVVELVVEAVELLHARPAVGCCCPARCASFHVPPPHCSLLTAH